MAEDKGPTRSEREERVLQFWKDNDIFEKTLAKDSPKGDFVFYEGPPTANGKPAIHHLEARVFKDALPRYKTMRGYRVPRQAGWDTHGLPVELEVEKRLGFKSKKDIEEYGVEKFNALCKQSVFEYIGDWEKFTKRIGYWVNLDEAYYTFRNSYIEKVWSVVAKAEERQLLYKDYKVLPWCPRCGTALSSHELAQGYQDVKDLSLYVKFKVVGQENTFLLAWTTTPWTLPGNLALAVGNDLAYVKVERDGEILILAEARLSIVEGDYKILEKVKGQDLVGLQYEPLYGFIKGNDKTFRVYPADFVTTEDGTGIVHTAVMYGQDDFELGTKIGLPKVHLVNPDGKFKPDLGWLAGRSVVDEHLAVDILKDLQKRHLLFAKENYLHPYPFCWRCKTRLIYYARDSWYIKMSSLRENLVKENEKINWEPEYIKDGRFGEWLKEVKDWAVSRERYWGTPLPIWQNESGERIIVDSIETLKKYAKKSGNTYFVIRHGQAENNLEAVYHKDSHHSARLTAEGKRQVAEGIKKLPFKPDLIICSTYTRTKETAEVVCEQIGFPLDKVIYDERIREWDTTTDFEGKDKKLFTDYYGEGFRSEPERALPDGESFVELVQRVGAFLMETEGKYQNKNILIVGHAGATRALDFIVQGRILEELRNPLVQLADLANAELKKFEVCTLPYNEKYELDLHKPFIDKIVLEKDGQAYNRVAEVLDVWLDSGSMPLISAGYPADFISEAIDQTRGWFYTLHAVGVIREKGLAFRNAICLGLLMDKEGKKMSKSVGNVIDPWQMIEKYGVDTLRLWMYSVNQPGESKNFDERSVEEVQKRIFNLLDNVYAFYALYRDEQLETDGFTIQSAHTLDTWIMLRLAGLTKEMTKSLDAYQLLEPVRALRDFVDDLSTWYLRRSRERIKSGDAEAKKITYFILRRVATLLAPLAPFAAEELYQKLRHPEDPESVHLTGWPPEDAEPAEAKLLLAQMEDARKIVSLALEQRQKANLKIRQPLRELKIKNAELGSEYLSIIREEINVKSVVSDIKLPSEVVLDTTLTPELIEEGEVRELIRAIQEMRKEKNLKPGEPMEYPVKKDERKLFEKYEAEITKATNVSPRL